ncbi:MAG: phosphatidylcholine/phosphatidylserine synthase, partial [Phycisphaerae bacterium]|nr:phosphatidylcholine/phosphatidylserine synthase [Phycisphaerae bacterium]
QPRTPKAEPRRGRRRILRSTSMLPALFTLSNGLAGFGAIHFATKDALGSANMRNLAVAAWLIFVAMVCDMLDGRLARMTRRTSDFGAQLDSLCDMISFGVGPAVLMLATVVMVLRGQVQRVSFLESYLAVERVVWCAAGVYVACAALRLARFNVESEPDESAHMDFRGLPTPGAAATVGGMVLLFGHLTQIERGWQSSPWILAAVSITLPVVTLGTALLMVSRFRYPHLVNQYIRGRRPFGYLVKLVLLALAAIWQPFVTLAVLTMAYTLSGPVTASLRLLRATKASPSSDEAPA